MASKKLIDKLHKEARIAMAPYDIKCVEPRNEVNSAYFEADSLYGKVNIGIHDAWISLKVEKARELQQEIGFTNSEINLHSGKWNIHVSDPKGKVNIDCVNTLITYFQARLGFLGIPVRDVCIITPDGRGKWYVLDRGEDLCGTYDTAKAAKQKLIKYRGESPEKIEVVR